MQIGLTISMLYQDQDIVEVAVTAWNGVFRGAVELYVGQNELEEVADKLRGFPTSSTDTRDLMLGTFDPQLVGGGASLRFSCFDMAGHIRLELALKAPHPLAECPQGVKMFANVDAASIDAFVSELIAVSRDLRNDAVLKFADPIGRA